MEKLAITTLRQKRPHWGLVRIAKMAASRFQRALVSALCAIILFSIRRSISYAVLLCSSKKIREHCLGPSLHLVRTARIYAVVEMNHRCVGTPGTSHGSFMVNSVSGFTNTEQTLSRRYSYFAYHTLFVYISFPK